MEVCVDTYYDTRPNIDDFVIVMLAILILNILVLTVSLLGSNTTWYQSLNKGRIDAWVIILLWLITTLLSYVGLFIFYSHVLPPCIDSSWPDQKSRNLFVAYLFVISSFLSLAWVALFFYIQNIGLSLWLISVLFMYKFWVFIYMWRIKPLAAIFLVPLLLMYVYLFYAVAHLATLNDIPL